MSLDKKVTIRQLRLILLKGYFGGCLFAGDFDAEDMVKNIDDFFAKCAGE